MGARHVVQQGECLATIAASYGFADWKTVFDHADNQQLRGLRANPNVLMPGDVVVIPDPKPKNVSLATGQRHRIVVQKAKVRFKLKLQSTGDEGFGGKRYQLQVGALQKDGQLADSGLIDEEIPADAADGELRLWLYDSSDTPVVIPIALGHLDPEDTTTGVKARLANLGMYDGPVDDQVTPELEEAVRAFQASRNLDETGQIDVQLSTELRRAHDGH